MTATRRWSYLVAAFTIAVLARLVPLPQEMRMLGEVTLTLQGQTTLGVLLFALLLWMTEAIPFHLTGLIGMFLSMWITNTAVAAMLMPLGVAILQEETVTPRESTFGKALMIACAWGPIIGGIMAPSGAGPNPLAIGFLREMAGVELTFLGWMAYGVPAGILILIPTWLVLLACFRPEIRRLTKSRQELRIEYKALPPMSREERVTMIVFLLTVLLWLTTPVWETVLGIGIPISMPVLLTATLLFFPGVGRRSWKTVEAEISWSSILLIVSGISLGMVLYRTGAATIVIPIMISLSTALGVDALSVTVPAALTTSMAFILVTSTPTNVIPYSAGYLTLIQNSVPVGSTIAQRTPSMQRPDVRPHDQLVPRYRRVLSWIALDIRSVIATTLLVNDSIASSLISCT